MKRVAIFGTGSGLTDILALLPSEVEVLGLGDNNAAKQGTQVAGHPVHAPEAFAQLPADLFVISAGAVDPIRAQLEGLGVAPDRIVAACPSHSVSLKQAANADIAKLNAELGIGLAPMGLATMYLCPDPDNLGAIVPSGDFVRIQSFRHAAEEVKTRGIAGSIAELGVYQGNQAALLNRLFPGRTLHLFDTFEGFASNDLATEKNSGFSGAAIGDFADTSVDLVLGKMADASVVQVHKGLLPRHRRGGRRHIRLRQPRRRSLRADACGARIFLCTTFEGRVHLLPRLQQHPLQGRAQRGEEVRRAVGCMHVPDPGLRRVGRDPEVISRARTARGPAVRMRRARAVRDR